MVKKIDYDEKDSGNTETHIAVDAAMEQKYGNIQNAYEEGFASASGVRGATAETSGRIKHPEKLDDAPARQNNPIADENAGLADN